MGGFSIKVQIVKQAKKRMFFLLVLRKTVYFFFIKIKCCDFVKKNNDFVFLSDFLCTFATNLKSKVDNSKVKFFRTTYSNRY